MNEATQCSYDCIFFIDETGDESCNDDKTPLFGLGGIKIDAKNYKKIRKDWIKCKDDIGYNNKPFHATDFEAAKPTSKQIDVINEFVKADFFRFFVCYHRETMRNEKKIEYKT